MIGSNWQRFTVGQSGNVPDTRFKTSAFKCSIAGLVPDKIDDPSGFDPRGWIEPRDIKKMDRFIQYAIAASREVLDQANWRAEEATAHRTATIVGSGANSAKPQQVNHNLSNSFGLGGVDASLVFSAV